MYQAFVNTKARHTIMENTKEKMPQPTQPTPQSSPVLDVYSWIPSTPNPYSQDLNNNDTSEEGLKELGPLPLLPDLNSSCSQKKRHLTSSKENFESRVLSSLTPRRPTMCIRKGNTNASSSHVKQSFVDLSRAKSSSDDYLCFSLSPTSATDDFLLRRQVCELDIKGTHQSLLIPLPPEPDQFKEGLLGENMRGRIEYS